MDDATNQAYNQLLRAVVLDQKERVTEIVQRGLDINGRNRHYNNALLAACNTNNASMVEHVIGLGASVKGMAILRIVCMLTPADIDEAGHFQLETDIEQYDSELDGNPEDVDVSNVFRVLLAHDAPTEEGAGSLVPMHQAAYCGRPKLVEMLLDAGATPRPSCYKAVIDIVFYRVCKQRRSGADRRLIVENALATLRLLLERKVPQPSFPGCTPLQDIVATWVDTGKLPDPAYREIILTLLTKPTADGGRVISRTRLDAMLNAPYMGCYAGRVVKEFVTNEDMLKKLGPLPDWLTGPCA